jgi:hypothetical protein
VCQALCWALGKPGWLRLCLWSQWGMKEESVDQERLQLMGRCCPGEQNRTCPRHARQGHLHKQKCGGVTRQWAQVWG